MQRWSSAKPVRAGACLTLAFATLAVVVPAQVAGAATLTVTSCADSGPGTLRAAVAAAGTGDTIGFNAPSGLSPACTTANTITLSSAITTSANNLTIQGPGAAVLAISGGGTTNVIETAGTGMTISGLAIVNGVRLSGFFSPFRSGGITNSGSLTVANSIVSGNHADLDGFGGGIWNQGSLTVTNTIVSGNGAAIGGGIYSSGSSLTVTNSTLSNNGAAGVGGAIVNGASSVLTVTNSTLSKNFGQNAGGGIDNSGPATVTGSTFSGNQAEGGAPGGRGGGGIINLGAMTIANSTLSSNDAFSTNGGAIDNEGSLTVTNSTFSNNTAQLGGQAAGIYNAYAANAVLTVGASIFDRSDCNSGPSTGYTDLGNNISDVATAPPCASLGVVTAAALNLDPAGPANNGGPTQTIALLSGSVAIGRVPASSGRCSTPDQRGVARPDPCDVGAYQTLAIGILFPRGPIRFERGLVIPVVFQLTGANHRPLPASFAAHLGCAISLTFNGGAPICATHIPILNVFGALVKTSRSLTSGVGYPIVVTFTLGTTTVATSTVTVIAR